VASSRATAAEPFSLFTFDLEFCLRNNVDWEGRRCSGCRFCRANLRRIFEEKMGGKQRGANRGFWDKGTVSKERMESHSEPLLNMAEREADVCDGKPREAPRVHESRQEEARRQPQAAATCSQSSQSLIPADVNGRMSLVDMVRSLKAAGTTSRLLPCGGIEAVPRLSGDDVATRLSQSGLDSLPRLLNGRADRSAITGIKSGVGSGACSVCHGQLLEFVKRGGGLSECGVSVGDRVGVLLPNGPEMAVCLLTCMASCVAMPINHQMVGHPPFSSQTM
jgi:hypothetical protein